MLRLKALPEELPLGTEELIRLLDAAVPRECIRPGDSVHEAMYQSGARTLVDILVAKLESDGAVKADSAENWWDDDPVCKGYVEGDW